MLSYLSVDRKTKKRLKEDLITQINEKIANRDVLEVLSELEDPKTFADNFIDEYETVPKELFKFEYKSKMRIFGIPLMHICGSNKINDFSGNIAKGIIAIAPISFGFLSFGAISLGAISFGAVSFGLLAAGAVSIGLLLAFGAVAIDLGAIGTVAIGYISRGVMNVEHTAIGEQVTGVNILEGEYLSRNEVYEFIKSHHPHLNDWIIRLSSITSS
ncbi:hypothetical protein RBH29_08495 [Herbivorax sp. ANBcel31]|uniref:hypothetical protein n=1 Tax=Herbivorax sp. ANBcel31 TaxID=3069754 RepID=UPI0027B4F13A|nr:hypothetical protein [Herbivorax sp. ANBcel31]MDQ2086466.1 hypothetical protein [Herbivorax sp. ANBcel31]